MKKDWGFEDYLIDLNYYQRTALAKFRCRSNYLPITKSRFTPCTDAELECPLCDSKEIGDEFHYLINCNYFADSREKYLAKRNLEGIESRSIGILFNTDMIELAKLANFTNEIMQVFKELR